jgi:uncharacterized phiE125 gp8 family phage protein
MSDLYAEALVTFRDLLEEAKSAGDPEPTAMTLATCDASGKPSARTVLLKDFDERGFVFYTNFNSRKGRQLQENPQAALLFLWKTLREQVQVKIEGTVEPVSLAEAKLHMRVEVDEDDALIAGLITAAREHLESTARPQLAMLTQTWRYVADEWPTGDTLALRPWPLQSVSSIKYTDEDGTEATLASTEYVVDIYSEPGRVRLKSTASWPSVTLAALNGLVVEFVAGYGETPGDLPQRLRQAVLLLVSHWYENREQNIVGVSVSQLPWGVEACLTPEDWGAYS